MRIAPVMISVLGLSIVVAADARHGYQLLGDRISFAVNATWVKLNGQTDRVVAFQVPNPAEQGTPESTNVAVMANSHPTDSLEDRIQSLTSSTGTLITRLPTRPSKRDVLLLYRGQQGQTPYIIADRLARRGKIEVSIRAAWPILESSTDEWQSELLAQINQLMSDVSIDGTTIGAVGHLVVHTHDDGGYIVRTVEAVE